MKINPLLMTDFYKVVHRQSYAQGLEYLTSYWTPRKSRIRGIDKVVCFGLQGILQDILVDKFKDNFFNRSLEDLINEYKRTISLTLSKDNNIVENGIQAITELYNLGYLPIRISAIEEGKQVPIGVPMLEITNTVKGFGWLVNYLETYISCNIWFPMTSATISHKYRDIVNYWYNKTCDNKELRKFAIGDFSMRGMTSFDSAIHSSASHLLSFIPTATIPAILWVEQHYNCNLEKELIGSGTSSMEHSVMSSYGRENEFKSYEHLLKDIFSKGKLSIVSDTYDYWKVITDYLPKLKELILNRDGTLYIRGDSGDPVDIIAGKIKDIKTTTEDKGTVELLWEIFGGTINEKGYKVLDPHIRAIYGDSITLERAEEIYKRLEAKGFSSENVSLGAGSYSFQYTTRDTFGFALKATHAIINGKEQLIYKDPITDTDKFKKSQKGKVVVLENENGLYCIDQLSIKDLDKYDNQLKPIFENGILLSNFTLDEIRNRLNNGDF